MKFGKLQEFCLCLQFPFEDVDNIKDNRQGLPSGLLQPVQVAISAGRTLGLLPADHPRSLLDSETSSSREEALPTRRHY